MWPAVVRFLWAGVMFFAYLAWFFLLCALSQAVLVPLWPMTSLAERPQAQIRVLAWKDGQLAHVPCPHPDLGCKWDGRSLDGYGYTLATEVTPGTVKKMSGGTRYTYSIELDRHQRLLVNFRAGDEYGSYEIRGKTIIPIAEKHQNGPMVITGMILSLGLILLMKAGAAAVGKRMRRKGPA